LSEHLPKSIFHGSLYIEYLKPTANQIIDVDKLALISSRVNELNRDVN